MCDVIEATQSSHLFGRFFLNSVLSAILGLGLLLLVACYVFVEFFINPMMLRSDQHYEGNSNASVKHPVSQPAYLKDQLHVGLDSMGFPTEEELLFLIPFVLYLYRSVSAEVMQCVSFQSIVSCSS